MIAKRIFDICVASFALVVALPFMLLAAFFIKTGSPGPVLYRQTRVGRNGAPFEILKLRTMVHSPRQNGPSITQDDDLRITPVGRFLRKWKLDEIPQFWNVLRGEMSVVGPRPEVQRYIDMYPEASRVKILSVRPGITDTAAIHFRHEGRILNEAADPEKEYVEKILPAKIKAYESYVDRQTITGDFILLFKTLFSLWS